MIIGGIVLLGYNGLLEEAYLMATALLIWVYWKTFPSKPGQGRRGRNEEPGGIRQDDVDGVIRIGGTRVTLDTLVAAFDAGATAEEIAQQYPSVTLADVYSVIGYYLRHRTEVREYLAKRQQHAAQVREENERRFDPSGIRDRLLARRG